MRPLRVDGVVGPRTVAAIEAYQSRIVRMELPDGKVDPNGTTLKSLSSAKLSAQTRPRVQVGSRQVEKPTPLWLSVAAGEASWLTVATEQDQIAELPGQKKNNDKILEYLRRVGYLGGIETSPGSGVKLDSIDETAWCACFVNWCLLKAGKTGLMSARAKDWLN
jgi:peptidoglycan hydrolase-like protein with peptidoglycan-binding domain